MEQAMSTRFKFVDGRGKFLLSMHMEGDRFTANFTDMEDLAMTVRRVKAARLVQGLLQQTDHPVVLREERTEARP